MDKFTQMQEVFDVLIRKENNCCFHYNAETEETSYFGEFMKEILFPNQTESPVEFILSSPFIACIDKKFFEEFQKYFMKAISKKMETLELERILTYVRNDERIPFSCVIRPILDCEGIVTGYAGCITSLANIKEQLQENPACLKAKAPFPEAKVTKMIQNAESNFAVITFDISRFKIINESYGDEFGDEVLEYIRNNLSNVWGKEAVTCRLGADIFAIYTEYTEASELDERIERVQQELQRYQDVSYQFVFGVNRANEENLSIREMTDRATIARRRERKNIFEVVRYYNQDDSRKLHRRHLIESQMESALEDGQFEVYLQPKCRIEDGAVIGAEGLVRWNHPQEGFMLPSEFIPLFETNGFVEKLDEFVHRKICMLIRKWLDMDLEVKPISVNVSRAYINKPGLVERVKKNVSDFNVPIDLFQLEITETYDNHDTKKVIKEFKDNGFTLLMDDFGAGYSSLNTLRKTVFDGIKLDRGFLGESMDSERDQMIVKHTISMINDIGLNLIAEGVETKNQASFLVQNGCKYAQGFLYSRPINVREFEKKVYGI